MENLMNNDDSNVVSMDSFRTKKRSTQTKKRPKQNPKRPVEQSKLPVAPKKSYKQTKMFELDCCYLYPEMGFMIHIIAITSKSYYYNKEMVYIMEDHDGRIFGEIMEEDTCNGWVKIPTEEFKFMNKK